MNTKIVVGIVTCLMVTGLFVSLPANVSASPTGWETKLEPGVDYNFTGGADPTPMAGYFWVNASDTVTFNWKSGTTGVSKGWGMGFNTMNLMANYSVDSINGYPPYAAYGASMTYSSAPRSVWVKTAVPEFMRIFILADTACTMQVFNFTITPDPNSPTARIKALEDQCAYLNASLNDRISNLTTYVSENLTRIDADIQDIRAANAVSAATLMERLGKLETDYGCLVNALDALSTELNSNMTALNASLSTSISELEDILASLGTNYTALQARVAALEAQSGTNCTNATPPNTSALEQRIATLEAKEYNITENITNITIINPSSNLTNNVTQNNTVYITRTVTTESTGSMAVGVGGLLMAGGAVVVVAAERRARKKDIASLNEQRDFTP